MAGRRLCCGGCRCDARQAGASCGGDGGGGGGAPRSHGRGLGERGRRRRWEGMGLLAAWRGAAALAVRPLARGAAWRGVTTKVAGGSSALLEARRTGATVQAVAKGSSQSDGFFARIRNTISTEVDKRTSAKKADQSTSLLSFLSGLERFNFEVWSDFLKTKMDEEGFSWKSKLPGFNRSFEVEQSKSTLEIISAMSDDERTCKVPIRPESVERIAAASGTSNDQVEQLIQSISQFALVHRWLRRRALDGIAPPIDFAELRIAMALDRRGTQPRPPRWMRKARFSGGNKGRKKRF